MPSHRNGNKMQHIQSDTYTIQATAETVFKFLSDTNNMQPLMPHDKVKNWQSDDTYCAFEIEGLASLQMRQQTKDAYNRIVWQSEGENPFPFQLHCNIQELQNATTQVSFQLDADMNPMLAMMAKRPLKNLLNHFCMALQGAI